MRPKHYVTSNIPRFFYVNSISTLFLALVFYVALPQHSYRCRQCDRPRQTRRGQRKPTYDQFGKHWASNPRNRPAKRYREVPHHERSYWEDVAMTRAGLHNGKRLGCYPSLPRSEAKGSSTRNRSTTCRVSQAKNLRTKRMQCILAQKWLDSGVSWRIVSETTRKRVPVIEIVGRQHLIRGIFGSAPQAYRRDVMNSKHHDLGIQWVSFMGGHLRSGAKLASEGSWGADTIAEPRRQPQVCLRCQHAWNMPETC